MPPACVCASIRSRSTSCSTACPRVDAKLWVVRQGYFAKAAAIASIRFCNGRSQVVESPTHLSLTFRLKANRPKEPCSKRASNQNRETSGPRQNSVNQLLSADPLYDRMADLEFVEGGGDGYWRPMPVEHPAQALIPNNAKSEQCAEASACTCK